MGRGVNETVKYLTARLVPDRLSQTLNRNRLLLLFRLVQPILVTQNDSHRILICALNNGSNALDFIYKRFCKMYNCMANSENTKLSMFIKMCKNDKRITLSRNLRRVCKNWGVSEL